MFASFNSISVDSLNVKLDSDILYGAAKSVFVRDSFAYVGATYSFLILNINDVDSIYVVGYLDIQGQIYQIYVENDYAYIAADDDGLYIIDFNSRSL